ncbi:MAG: glycosyltransferase family 2 protein [Lachnospiraceae bacterium]|nr:glycosyltransferase family 2 protein [Lachnospiraceae bacterium]
MVSISLCMIVKNEESILGRCLDGFIKLVDEIVIVDTGSTDRTKAIASLYTKNIYDFEWGDDFAEARNFAFSKCTKDYILSVDADEVIDYENKEKFKILKEALLPEIDIVQMIYTNQLYLNTTYNFDEELRPKLYKRVRSFFWEDPIHESVRLSPVIYDSDIKIKHMPEGAHQSRDFAIFKKLTSDGSVLSNKLHKMYARELFISGSDEDFIDAMEYFKTAMDRDSDRDMILMDSAVCTKAARLSDDKDLMLKAVSRGLACENPPSEIVFELGEYYRSKRDYHEAVMWYYNAAFETESLLNRKYHDSFPFIGLHISFVILGDIENAAKYAALAKERG